MWSGCGRIISTSTTIEHRLATEIESIFCTKQTCFKGKEYLVKYTGCHHKEAIWMKFAHCEDFLHTFHIKICTHKIPLGVELLCSCNLTNKGGST